MMIKIESGQAEVIASGTVIAFSGDPINITFGSQNETLKLIFEFKDEEGKGKESIRVDANQLDPKTLKLTLFNFKNSLGSGTSKPIPIGSLDGKRLHIHYRVYSLTGSDKMLHFNIYKGEEVSKSG